MFRKGQSGIYVWMTCLYIIPRPLFFLCRMRKDCNHKKHKQAKQWDHKIWVTWKVSTHYIINRYKMYHSKMTVKGNVFPLHQGPRLQLAWCQSSVTWSVTRPCPLSRFRSLLCLTVSRIHLNGKHSKGIFWISASSLRSGLFFLGKR